MPIINPADMKVGGLATGVKNSLTPAFGIKIVIWVFAIGMIGMASYIIWDFLRTHARAWIYDERTNEYKTGIVKKTVNKKTRETNYLLSTTKETIAKEVALIRTKFKKNYVCFMVRGLDGHLRSTTHCADYVDENGISRPYYHAVDNNLKDHIWHDMKQDSFKYKLTSTLEKLAPYATFALVSIMSMMMWYVTNGRG
jgi:hypothetical protein